MYAFDPSAPQPSPLAEMLAVFSRPRREDDEPPEPIVSSGWSPEPSEAARAREDEAIESTLPLSYRLPLPGRARRRERLRASFANCVRRRPSVDAASLRTARPRNFQDANRTNVGYRQCGGVR
jgi:hypothetical protein